MALPLCVAQPPWEGTWSPTRSPECLRVPSRPTSAWRRPSSPAPSLWVTRRHPQPPAHSHHFATQITLSPVQNHQHMVPVHLHWHPTFVLNHNDDDFSPHSFFITFFPIQDPPPSFTLDHYVQDLVIYILPNVLNHRCQILPCAPTWASSVTTLGLWGINYIITIQAGLCRILFLLHWLLFAILFF